MDFIEELRSELTLKILMALSLGPNFPRAIAQMIGASEQSVSRKLKVLQSLGLVESRWARLEEQNVKLYSLRSNRITLEFVSGKANLIVDGVPVNTSVIRSPKPPPRLRERERELAELESCDKCIVWGMPGIGKTALISAYVHDKPHAWIWSVPTLTPEGVEEMVQGDRIIVVDDAHKLRFPYVAELSKYANKVIVGTRVLPTSTRGWKVIRLGALNGGTGNPAIDEGLMSPAELVEELALSRRARMYLKTLSVIGPLRVSEALHMTEWAQPMFRSLYRLGVLRRRGVHVDVERPIKRFFRNDATPLVEGAEKAYGGAHRLVAYYVKRGELRSLDALLDFWLRRGSMRLFFEKAHVLAKLLEQVPNKSQPVRAALAKAYAAIYDYKRAEAYLSQLEGRYRDLAAPMALYLMRRFSEIGSLEGAPLFDGPFIRISMNHDLTVPEKLGGLVEESTEDMAALYYAKASAYLARGDIDIAVELYRRAVAEARKAGARRITIAALCNLGNALSIAGKPTESKLVFVKALELAQNDPGLYVIALYNYGVVLQSWGEVDAALHTYKEAYERARDIGLKREEGYSLLGLAEVLTGKGLYWEAARRLELAVNIARELGDTRLTIYALTRLAQALIGTGDLRRARQTARECASMANAKMYKIELADCYRIIGNSYAEEGKYIPAFMAYDKALRLVSMAKYNMGKAQILLDYATAAMRFGEREKAARYAAVAAAIYERLGKPEVASDIRQRFGL